MSNLKLRYAFLTSKNPLVASPRGGGDTVYTDLVVIISNPNQTGTIDLREIDITIPVGSDKVVGDLSADTEPFSGPLYDAKCGWKITGAGEIITLSPHDLAHPRRTFGTISGSVIFTLPNVAVNTRAGTVQLKITEQLKGGAVLTDPLSYTLVKQENDYVITSFRSQPAVLDDIDQSVTFYWTTTDAGKDLTYSIPLIGDDRYQRADGVKGVSGPLVEQTKTFTLDAISTAGGQPKIIASADATILVEAPKISQDSTFDQSPSGLLMGLRWVATNTGRMQVNLDTHVKDAYAPRDTYHSPFSLVVQGGPVHHHVDLVAFAGSGHARASMDLPEFETSKPVMVPFQVFPVAVAATNEAVLVAVANVDDQHPAYLWSLDRRTGTVQKKVPIGKPPTGIVAVPGPGPLRVLATHNTLPELTVVDVDSGTATVIALTRPYESIAVTPDGALAVLTTMAARSIAVIDLKTLTLDKTTIPLNGVPMTIAITPDGTTALVPLVADNKVTLTAVDIAGRTETGPPLPLPALIQNLAVTPDGSLALASDAGANAIIVIDLGSWTVENGKIAVGPAPSGIAVTPDGRYAFTANASADSETSPSVSVIDVGGRATCAEVHVGKSAPTDVVISPDGLCAVVYLPEDNAIAIL